MSGLGERPNPERLAAGDVLAAVIPVTFAPQRETQRLDVQVEVSDPVRHEAEGRTMMTSDAFDVELD